MKKSLLFAVAFASTVLFLNSCAKTTSVTNHGVENEMSGTSGNSSVRNKGTNPGLRVPSSTVWITMSANSEYISGYMGGVNFGTTLPHDITSDPSGSNDGKPCPNIGYVMSAQGPSYPDGTFFTISGAYFDLIQPTLAVTQAGQAQIEEYQAALKTFYSGGTSYPDALTITSGPGYREIKGVVIYDHTSPTNISVASDKYKYTAPASSTPVIGGIILNPYHLIVHGYYANSPIGNVTGVEVSIYNFDGSQQALTVANFSLTYEVNSDGSAALITGTISLLNGTVINVNDNAGMA